MGSKESPQVSQLKRYLDTISQRKWLILCGFMIGITCGLIFYLKQDNVYKSEVLLSSQQQQINPSRTFPDEQVGIRELVSTLAEIVVSKPSLEKLIKEEDLYRKSREALPMEDVVGMMRDSINIVQSITGDSFVIEYEGSDPAQVVRVANALAAIFLDENLQYREERASEKVAYSQDDLEVAKEMLDRKEEVMRDYKLKYYNEMPDQRAINTSRLIALQVQYQARLDSIQDQINVRKQLVDENQSKREPLQTGGQKQGTLINIDQRAKLEMLQNGLSEIQDRYTDQHPTVTRLKKHIADVEKIIEEEKQNNDARLAETERQRNFEDELLSLQIQLKNISLSINKLEQEKEELQAMISAYEKWIASTTVREAEWSSLTREYGDLKMHYDFLVAQNLQALSSPNLERKQKGNQFRIENPARISETPVKPNFRKILFVAIMAGLFVGGSFAFGADIVDTSFRNQAELEQTLNLPVLCLVPNLPLAEETIKKRFWSVLKVSFFMIWFFSLCIALVIWGQEGKIITPYLQFLR